MTGRTDGSLLMKVSLDGERIAANGISLKVHLTSDTFIWASAVRCRDRQKRACSGLTVMRNLEMSKKVH